MRTSYNYKCFDCGKTYDKDQIEKNLIYLCPTCGKIKKNQPLRGVLLIEYDYESIKRKYKREDFLKLQTGKFWLYSSLWPLNSEDPDLSGDEESHKKAVRTSSPVLSRLTQNDLNKISLPQDCFLELLFDGNKFFILDDTRNPTLSFKDRASSLVALKAIELGIDFISTASTGNAGSSLAGICARLGLKSSVFVPKHIPEAKRIQIQSFGAELVLVDGDYDLAFDTCLDISISKKWYNRNTGYNPLTIEGKKSAVYDIFISTKGKMPDLIFIPTGDGVILSGVYKGLWELKQLGWIEQIPKLIAVQSSGGNAFARYMKDKKFEYQPAVSIADSICAGAPRALYYGYEALIQTNGEVIEVSDEEILEAQKYSAEKFGIIIEPSSSSSLAAYKKYIEQGKLKNQKALLLFTGNGLKDVSALAKWNKAVQPLTPTQIKEKYLP